MSICIRQVQTTAEAKAVFRLRYEVYVEELAHAQRHADHAARWVEEPLDRTAVLLGAFEGDRLVGTVRLNYARSGGMSEYAELYEMRRVGAAFPSHVSMTTKLLVAPAYRNTTLGYRLSSATYARALADGVLHDFIYVYAERVPFFERLGYRVHLSELVHPEYGRVIVMRLGMRDAEHLRRVRSPFLRYLEAIKAAA